MGHAETLLALIAVLIGFNTGLNLSSATNLKLIRKLLEKRN